MHRKTNTYRKFLLPFTLIYALIINVRNWLFDVEILKSKSYFTPMINVGNITIGGTGKTPHIEYLIRLLKQDFKIATLSRGYKRETKGFIEARTTHTYKDIGDEPKQLSSQFPDITVSVDGDRRRGVESLQNLTLPPELILLDDAFQHRYVKPGLNILLTDYFYPYWADTLLPVGNLRDSKSQVKRADIVIVTKTPNSISPIKKRIIKTELNLFPYQNLFFTTIQYGDLVSLGENTVAFDSSYSVLLLTGIAKPQHLKHYLKSKFSEIKSIIFPDHHAFKDSDASEILKAYDSIPNPKKMVVTTLKDAVRLKDNRIFAQLSSLPIFYQAIQVGFLCDDDEQEFKKLILKYVRNAQRDRKVY